MRRLAVCLLVALLANVAPWVSFVLAAVSVVDAKTCNGNDCTVTFDAAMLTSNHIRVSAIINDESNTAEITGITDTEVVLHGPTDHSTQNMRLYEWCFVGDGSDTAFVVTTSASASARVSALKLSGASCTEDGTSATNEDGTSTYVQSVTTTAAGSFLSGIIHSNSVADYSADTGSTSNPADGTEIGTIALGAWKLCGSAGPCEIGWSSAASETSLLGAAAVLAEVTSATPPRTLLGFFR